MKDYQGLLTDFDGTVHKFNHEISPRVLAALRRLKAKAIPFGFCTGRQFDFIEPFAIELGRAHVVCGGACLVDSSGQVLRQHSLPAAVVREIFALVDAAGGVVAVKDHYQGYANARSLEIARTKPGLRLLPIADIPHWECLAIYVSHLEEAHWEKLLSRTDISLCRQKFRDSEGTFADIVPLGVSKSTGVRWWCEYHHLDPQDVIGIGDGENDLELLKTVGLGLAMGNAVPQLKRQAQAILPDIDADGVAWAIEQYFERGPAA